MTSCEEFEPHPIRKVCNKCRLPKEDHALSPSSFAKARTELDLVDDAPQHSHPDYAWIPKKCPLEKVEEFFSHFPEAKVPRVNSEGETYRAKQLAIQIPEVDQSAKNCRFIDEVSVDRFTKYIVKRNEKVLDEGFIKILTDKTSPVECASCQRVMTDGEMTIASENRGKELAWHPECFTCAECKEMPVDLIHCIGKYGRVFCIRHYDEMFKPRCYACDELIFDLEHMKAMSTSWHAGHFCCNTCDATLAGKTFVQKHGNPYCETCFETQFRHLCKRCHERIGLDQVEIICQGDRWHEECFLCEECGEKLNTTEHQFARLEGKMVCPKCYALRAPKCTGCGKPFDEDICKLEYKKQAFHPKCFVCFKCKKPIDQKKFVVTEGNRYCIPCYSDDFATRCEKCRGPIVSSGLTFRGKHYHKECFRCSVCHTIIPGKCLMKDEKAYCENCYAKCFAKKCRECGQAIMGNVRYIGAGSASWHQECFRCVRCNNTIRGKFASTSEGLLCGECVRPSAKLSEIQDDA